MKIPSLLIAFLITVLLSSCATVPDESVALSRELGAGITKQYQAEIDLINMHFALKRNQLDESLRHSMRTYFSALTPSDSITLTRSQFSDISEYVLTLNKRYKSENESLEQLRLLLLKKLHENYLALDRANASITALLQSDTDVRHAAGEAVSHLSGAVNQHINLNSILTKVDRVTTNIGDKSAQLNNLIDSLSN